MAGTPWLEPFEQALNRRINRSETASALLADLTPRRFGIRIDGIPGQLCLRADGTRLRIGMADAGQPVEAAVSGSVVALAALAAGDAADTVRSARVEVRGDAEIAQRFQQLLRAAAPDWEDELSRIVGDIAAHQLGRSVRAVGDASTRMMDALGRRVADYLQHDSGDLVDRAQQATFSAAVERLRDDAERLTARIARLESDRPSGDDAQ